MIPTSKAYQYRYWYWQVMHLLESRDAPPEHHDQVTKVPVNTDLGAHTTGSTVPVQYRNS
jgi:hypothetical protein